VDGICDTFERRDATATGTRRGATPSPTFALGATDRFRNLTLWVDLYDPSFEIVYMNVQKVVPAGWREREVWFLLASLAVMILSTLFVGEMLASAWQSWGLPRHLISGALNALDVGARVFFYLPVGIYVGVVVALLLDSYKFTQGALVSLMSLVAIPTVLLPNGILIEPLAQKVTPATLLLAGLAALATLRGLGVTLEALSGGPREFPLVPKVLFAIALLVSLWGLVDAHVLYQSPITAVDAGYDYRTPELSGFEGANLGRHVAGTALLLGSLYVFTTYERDLKVIMIGPRRSGKSAALGGLQLYIRDEVSSQSDATPILDDVRKDIENGRFPSATQMSVQRGGGSGDRKALPRLLELPYRWGWFFPQRVNFSAVDYPGDALGQILEPFVERAQRLSGGYAGQAMSDGGERTDDEWSLDGEDAGDEWSFDDDDSGDEWSTEPSETTDSSDDWPTGAGADDDAWSVGGDDSDGSATDERTGASKRHSEKSGRNRWRVDDESRSRMDDEWTVGSEESDLPGPTERTDDESGGLREWLRRLGRALTGGRAGRGSGNDIDPFDSWRAAKRTIRDAESPGDIVPGIQGCIQHADRIVLLFPLHDYVAPVIERGNVPDYLSDRVVEPSELDDYSLGELSTFEYEGDLYGLRGPDRESPEEYLNWYHALRYVLDDTDFVLVGTMADWMLDDFEANYSGRAPNPSVQPGYDEFREHVFEEIVREQEPTINDIVGGRNEGEMYLLWYDIPEDDPYDQRGELRIERQTGSILKGAEPFMNRINR
jgi:hypothetical protein